LFWVLEDNESQLRCQASIARVMHRYIGAQLRWTDRQIKRAADRRYVAIKTVDELPSYAVLQDLANDYRARYPIPTEEFHRLFQEWAELRANVGIRTLAKARHYNGGALPIDADIPDDVEWDYVALQKIARRRS